MCQFSKTHVPHSFLFFLLCTPFTKQKQKQKQKKTKQNKRKQDTMRDIRFPTFFILLCTPFYKTGWLNELGSWIT